MNEKLQSTGLVFVLGFLLFSGCTQAPPETPLQEYHAHADLLVILDGKTLDLNKEEFMSTPYRHLSEDTHLHDFNPFVVHFHKEGVSIGEFFESLGMKLGSQCFDDGKKQYCANEEKKLFFYANGKKNNEFEAYVPIDLDKILVYYGETEPSQEIIGRVLEQACIYSEKCPVPKGFVLPQESCSATKPCVLPE